MAGAFLADNWVRAAGVGLSSWPSPPATLPLSNLLDPQPRVRTRLAGATGVALYVDLGTARQVDCMAVLSTTMRTGAYEWQWSTGGPSSWSGKRNIADDTDDEAAGALITILPTAVSLRYATLWLDDPIAATRDIGLLVIGRLWRLRYGHQYGIREGRLILDQRERNPLTGAEFVSPALANPRLASFQVPLASTDRSEHRSLLRTLGAAGETLWIPALDLSPIERNRRALWGAVAAPGDEAAITRSSFPLGERGFRLVERL
jgi:hypothetical protein